ncbi:hypothetical protein HN51_027160 [Arachis hypogaea]|uniref:Uncharacterized protein n=2 Tax=Arachis TaxID=3817 RepID=A0A445BP91_ARAHY|nr:uncharacterized protein LOC107464271 [Arachis duranensis]XP_025617987.1 uncharacterized protein LOC112710104 [Arachis hypogaea]XP_057735515.1 uncharacterized protein LOC130950930 [Arachis stenosperma]QHO33467.1 uncharacterized protein DS421_9g258470 [Arachis hypogaea]RYR40461.1 hypothetical protein Ahy_A09g046218 [Arachis hypogaea]
MSEGDQTPKLFTNKPRKEQIKRHQKQAPMGTQTAAAAATAPPPPPPPPKESFFRRHKFLLPVLLAVNLAIGVMYFRTNKKDTGVEEEEDASSISTKDATSHVTETTVTLPPITTPVIKQEPIPEDQQRELFKWILEEKRKIKPKDADEKKRIDEEKALLKQFIRSKSIPHI